MRLTAFPPLADRNAKLLILGSMPGARSLEENRYYAHPRNAFWQIVSDCYGGSRDNYAEITQRLLDAGVALWDVLLHCERPGSLDAHIKQDTIVCNDFEQFLTAHQSIENILFNGKTALHLFEKHIKPEPFFSNLQTQPKLHSLPSTSPAMAAMSYPEKLAIWRRHLF